MFKSTLLVNVYAGFLDASIISIGWLCIVFFFPPVAHQPNTSLSKEGLLRLSLPPPLPIKTQPSDCGRNSTLEALWYGVPIITWPLYAEQHINAFQLVKDLGLAEELTLDFRRDCPTDIVRAEDITKAVKTMTEQGGEFRNKAEAISEMAQKAVVEGGSSYVSLGNLINQLLENNP